MRLRQVQASRRLPWPSWATITVAVWVALVVAVGHLARRTGHDVTVCPLKRLTGVPCPSCGTGRAGLSLLRGDVVGGWLYNPLMFSLAAVAGALLALRLVLGRKLSVSLTRRERALAWALAAALLLCNWAYVIRYVG